MLWVVLILIATSGNQEVQQEIDDIISLIETNLSIPIDSSQQKLKPNINKANKWIDQQFKFKQIMNQSNTNIVQSINNTNDNRQQYQQAIPAIALDNDIKVLVDEQKRKDEQMQFEISQLVGIIGQQKQQIQELKESQAEKDTNYIELFKFISQYQQSTKQQIQKMQKNIDELGQKNGSESGKGQRQGDNDENGIKWIPQDNNQYNQKLIDVIQNLIDKHNMNQQSNTMQQQFLINQLQNTDYYLKNQNMYQMKGGQVVEQSSNKDDRSEKFKKKMLKIADIIKSRINQL